MEKLEKSVQDPLKPSFPWVTALAVALAFSLTGNLVLGASYGDERRWREGNFEAWERAKAEKEDLMRELAELRGQVEDVTGNHWAYGLSSEAGRFVWRACRENPSDRVFAPESVNWRVGGEIRFDNPAPIENDAGFRFLPGEACRIASDAEARITREADVFKIRYTVDGAYGATCPDGAYVFVSDRNELVRAAVSVACLKYAKAFELATPYGQ